MLLSTTHTGHILKMKQPKKKRFIIFILQQTLSRNVEESAVFFRNWAVFCKWSHYDIFCFRVAQRRSSWSCWWIRPRYVQSWENSPCLVQTVYQRVRTAGDPVLELLNSYWLDLRTDNAITIRLSLQIWRCECDQFDKQLEKWSGFQCAHSSTQVYVL